MHDVVLNPFPIATQVGAAAEALGLRRGGSQTDALAHAFVAGLRRLERRLGGAPGPALPLERVPVEVGQEGKPAAEAVDALGRRVGGFGWVHFGTS